MRKAVIYARVSSKEQAKHGYSIPAQVDLLTQYAKENKLSIVDIFKDEETAKQAGRTNFNRMIKFLKKTKTVKIILVEKTDRLYRNFKDYVTIDDLDLEMHLVKEHEVISQNSKSHQKFIHGIKVLMAKNYIDNLSEEVKKGQLKKAETGILPTFAPPGYLNKNKRIELNPPYDLYIRQLFEWFSTGNHSIKSLTTLAKDQGLTHPQTKRPFTKSSVHRILSTTFYYGLFDWGGKTFKGTHEPIISKDLYDEVQRILKKKNHGSETKRDFPFAGLLTCKKCGCAISAEVKKGKYVYYHCSYFKGRCGNDYIRQAKLDKLLGDVIHAINIPDEVADWMSSLIKDEMKQFRKRHHSLHNATEKRIEIIKQRIDRAYLDKQDGNITAEYWDEVSKKWQAELASLKLSQTQSLGSNQNFEIARNTLELSKTAYFQYVNADWPEKKKLLNSVLSNCSYYQENLDPVYKKPFDALVKGNKTGDWRRGWDSNPRHPEGAAIFETAPFVHSGTSPKNNL